jgi:hypothetical protein
VKLKPISIYIIIINIFAIKYNLRDPKTKIFIIILDEINRLIENKFILIELNVINNNSINLKKNPHNITTNSQIYSLNLGQINYFLPVYIIIRFNLRKKNFFLVLFIKYL